LDERALVEGLIARDEAATEAFLERYRAPLLHCIGRFEREPSAQEDLFQELAMHLLSQISERRFDPERGSLGSWLYRVAWCRCVDHRRRRRGVETGPEDEGRELAAPMADPAEHAERSELGELVRQALEDLEPEAAMLVRLRYLEGLSIVALSRRAGLPLETAKYRLKKATERMRGRLMSHAGEREVVDR
jgi:RNA polymerase sigma-70 factor (ECF subfamily)